MRWGISRAHLFMVTGGTVGHRLLKCINPMYLYIFSIYHFAFDSDVFGNTCNQRQVTCILLIMLTAPLLGKRKFQSKRRKRSLRLTHQDIRPRGLLGYRLPVHFLSGEPYEMGCRLQRERKGISNSGRVTQD